jgi:hypothetical protein
MGGLTMYGPAMPCMDPDRPLTPSELEEIRRELYPDDDDDDTVDDDTVDDDTVDDESRAFGPWQKAPKGWR